MNVWPGVLVQPGMRKLCLAVGVLALVLPALASAAADSEKVSKTLKLSSGGTLRLNSFSGRVTITPSDKDEVTIEAVRHGDHDWLDRYRLEIYSEGSSTVVVKENQHDNSWFGWSRKNRAVET